jgi:hypothetical protein
MDAESMRVRVRRRMEDPVNSSVWAKDAEKRTRGVSGRRSDAGMGGVGASWSVRAGQLDPGRAADGTRTEDNAKDREFSSGLVGGRAADSGGIFEADG